MRTYGEREILYKKARQLGVIFIRFSLDRKPVVAENGKGLTVTVFDPLLQQELEIEADYVNLATAIVPADNTQLAEFYKLPLNEDKFFMEAHPKCGPWTSPRTGFSSAASLTTPSPWTRTSLRPRRRPDGRPRYWLGTPSTISPLVSQVDAEKCIGCGLCEEVCPFGAIILEEVEGKGYRAQNISASCKGCGLCASTCPQNAIDMLHFRQAQIAAAIKAVA